MKCFCSFSIVACVFYSCKKETAESTAAGVYYSYFPLQTGNWVIYDVDSIAHLTNDDATGQPDTSIATYHFKIKEIIDSDFIDGEGDQAFRISRYRQMNDTLPWDFEAVWVAVLKANSAQRVEENNRYIKLAFPMDLNTSWNGNAYNNFLEEDYSYTEIHVPRVIGGYNFDSTVSVLQVDENNFLNRIYKEEKYANHVGLVYKLKDSLNYNGIQQVTNGFEYTETIESFGN